MDWVRVYGSMNWEWASGVEVTGALCWGRGDLGCSLR